MKKALLAILVISSLFATLNVKAQGCGTITACNAGPNTQTGFPVPDSIPCAIQGNAYNYSIPFKMYSTFDYIGVHGVDSMTIDTIFNLPCGLCWSLNKASKTYTANEIGCITISGTTNDAIGQYNLRLSLQVYLTGNGGTAISLSPNTVDAAGIKIWQRVAASSGSCTAVDTSASATDQVAASSCSSQQAGINCSGGRYHDFIFPTVDSSTVTYSTANGTTLQMDIFQPHGDTVSQRPVIILAHEGSFTGGTRSTDPTVSTLCKNMAYRGYVTASIDYRLGSALNMASDSAYALNELAESISDAKAAVRFFRQDASTTKTYKEDPNLIFGGGNSSGAIIFLHVGYIDSVNECPPALITALNNNGGFNGNSGNSGYSSQISAVINLAGGLNSPALISLGDIPSVNFQGTADAVTPYYCADYENGFVAMRICGLGSMTPYYQAAGINYQNTLYPGLGHVPWDATDSELVQIDTVVANFLLPLVCTGSQIIPLSVTLGTNQTVCSGTLVQLTAAASNGQPPYTYSWSSTGNSLTCNNCQVTSSTIIQNSTFTVTVTDANNSTATASVSYTIGGAGTISISAAGPTTFCTGGSVVLSVGGYTSYNWSNGSTTSNISATQSGTYAVTVSNNSGCSSTGNITVNTVAPPNTQSVIGNPAITPFQTYNYTVSQVSGITYTWIVQGGAIQSGQGSNGVSIEWGGTGPYLVELVQTNAGNCSDTSSLLVINSSCTLQIALSVVRQLPVCSGDTVLLIASVNANGPAYQWVQNGSLITGAVSDTLFATTSGNYQVSVTANGCTSLSSVNTVSFLPAPALPVISSNVNINGCNTQPVTLTLNNAYTAYSWSTGDLTSTATITVSGSYVVTVTGSNQCSAVSAPYNLNLSIINPVDICIVSVDSATGKNIIVWNNPQLTAIDSFLVYKEGQALNVFNEIGGIAGTDFSTFIDVNSNPAQEANRYTLAELDSCGHLTLQSLPHQTIHLSINQGIGNTWNLIWNAYQGFTFPSYYIYRGTTGGTLSQITTIASSSTSYTDLNPPTGTAFYQVGIENPNGCNPSRSSNYSQSLSNIVNTSQVGIQTVLADNIDMYSYNINAQNIVRVINDNTTAYGLRLYEISGRLVLDKPGRNTEETILPETLAKGVYIAEAYFTNGIMKKIKVVVR